MKKHQQVTFTIPKPYYHRMKKLKDEKFFTMSWLIREAVKDFLKKYEGEL